MNKFVKGVAGFIFLIGLLSFVSISFNGCTAAQQRNLKTLQSDWSGGLERVVLIYSYDGKLIHEYKGKIDFQPTDGGKVIFDLDGKRIILYNCVVISEER